MKINKKVVVVDLGAGDFDVYYGRTKEEAVATSQASCPGFKQYEPTACHILDESTYRAYGALLRAAKAASVNPIAKKIFQPIIEKLEKK